MSKPTTFRPSEMDRKRMEALKELLSMKTNNAVLSYCLKFTLEKLAGEHLNV